MIDKHTDMAVYLNARGMKPFMHAATDANNSLADVCMQCVQCAAYFLSEAALNGDPTSAFV
jgi:hypothetical protein